MTAPKSSARCARSLLTPFAAFALCATLAACGKPDSQPAATAQTDKLCAAIKDAGYAKKCSANPRDRTVGIAVDTSDDQAARERCASVASSIKPLSNGLGSHWQLQVYSPYRDDKPLAECPLD